MAKDIAFENGKISNLQGLMTLTLTLDRVIQHTVVHHSDGRIFETGFTGLTLKSRVKNTKW